MKRMGVDGAASERHVRKNFSYLGLCLLAVVGLGSRPSIAAEVVEIRLGEQESVFEDGFETGNFFDWTQALFGSPDVTPPLLEIISPSGDFVFNDNTPVLDLTFSDSGSGLASGSLQVRLDGVDILDTCAVEPDSALCESPVLSEGNHDLEIVIWDQGGNRTRVIRDFAFVNDLNVPLLTIVGPPAGVLFEDFTPGIELEFEDAPAGIDPSSLLVEIDGDDIAGTCEATEIGTECLSPLLDPGPHTLEVHISDFAGNEAVSIVSFELRTDQEHPVLVVLEPGDGDAVSDPVITVAGTATDDGTVVSVEVNGEPAVISGDTFSTAVPLEEGHNRLLVVATDQTGKQAALPISVTLDSLPPEVMIEVPGAGQATNAENVLVRGSVVDATGVAAVTVNGNPVVVSVNRFETTVDLAEGTNLIAVSATDVLGNTSNSAVSVERRTVPEVHVTSPADGSQIFGGSVAVIGTISDPSATVTVNGIPAAVVGTEFQVAAVPLQSGGTILDTVATSSSGAVGTSKTKVYRDTEPPRLEVYWPSDGAMVHEDSISVQGLVNDLVFGTVNAEQVEVEVNGVAATVANRSFFLPTVPLVLGENPISVVATDAAGNTANTAVVVLYAPLQGSRIERVGGNLQEGEIGTALPQALAVRVVDAVGDPVNGQPVVFRVTVGNGSLNATNRSLVVHSDALGQAQVNFQLGTRAGAAVHQVAASAAGFAGEIIFMATASAGQASQVHVDTGNQQVGATGADLPDSFGVVATDSGFNRVAGAEVLFEVVKGSGSWENALLSHKLHRKRPDSLPPCYNGATTQTIENKEGTKPWLTILPSFPRFSDSCRDMNSRTLPSAIIAVGSCDGSADGISSWL